MKKIGLIGGMSWESTLVYYKIINEKVKELLGGFHSCISVLESLDFAEIERLQHKNDWKSLCSLMVDASRNLEKSQAEMIVLCTNTMHLCSDEIERNVNIPVLHIAHATGQRIKTDKFNRVLLLGTQFTMERNFYSDILLNDFGINTIIPEEKDRKAVHSIIYEELVHGNLQEESREIYKTIINKSIQKGAQGVILGCTEIPLLIQSEDVDIPIYDTTRIHAETAVEFALKK